MFNKENNPDETNNNPFKENTEEEMKQENTEASDEETASGDKTAKSREEELTAALDSLNNKYIRLAADFDNFRKRQMAERESLLKYGAEDTLKKIIAVLDTFERAKDSVDKIEDCKTVKDSYEVVFKQLVDTLNKIGLTKIEAKGEAFNPEYHEAVMQTPTTEHPNHTVINELQAGYKYHDRVLRPVMVNVAVNDGVENNTDTTEE